MCDVTRSYVRHDSFIRVTCSMNVSPNSCRFVKYSSFMCVTCGMMRYWQPSETICDTTYLYLWHDSFVCVTWLVHMCDMNHLYAWHNSFICVTWLIWKWDMTWLIHMGDMTHSYVWADSFIRVTSLIHTCDMTHPHAWHDSFILVQSSVKRYPQMCICVVNVCLCGKCVFVW